MSISKAEYVASYPKVTSCPVSDMAEFAFVGRSNVGKSSLINMLTNKKSLAKVSNTPGKTQMINYFIIDNKWHLVDLPGYGYARVDKAKKSSFNKMLLDYLLKRETLACTFILIDVRLPLQKIDRDFLSWMGEQERPFVIVFTKADKLTKEQVVRNMKEINKELLKDWLELPAQFLTSAVSRQGKEEILQYIEGIVKLTNV